MASMLKLALAASAIVGLASSLPADIAGRQTWAPGVQNNTQEFTSVWLSLMAPELTRDGQVCAGPWGLGRC